MYDNDVVGFFLIIIISSSSSSINYNLSNILQSR